MRQLILCEQPSPARRIRGTHTEKAPARLKTSPRPCSSSCQYAAGLLAPRENGNPYPPLRFTRGATARCGLLLRKFVHQSKGVLYTPRLHTIVAALVLMLRLTSYLFRLSADAQKRQSPGEQARLPHRQGKRTFLRLPPRARRAECIGEVTCQGIYCRVRPQHSDRNDQSKRCDETVTEFEPHHRVHAEFAQWLLARNLLHLQPEHLRNLLQGEILEAAQALRSINV